MKLEDKMTENALISPLALAPMIDWTYNHFRVLMRLIMPQSLLYTEMLTSNAVLHHPERFLKYLSCEHPIALQLGGAEPKLLSKATQCAEEYGYQEVNLNLGCPSDRVQSGQFGACLMKSPGLVAECIHAMKEKTTLYVSAKIRIGVDEQDSYAFFEDFAAMLIAAGVDKIIVHARKAWLKGLSPKQNRMIPPLHYPYVYQLKLKYPHIPIVINGNIQTVEDSLLHLQKVDGVMIGRLCCENPYALQDIHHAIFGLKDFQSRVEIIEQYFNYARLVLENGANWGLVVKPILNIAHGLPHARLWKEAVLTMAKLKSLDEMKVCLSLLAQLEQSYSNVTF